MRPPIAAGRTVRMPRHAIFERKLPHGPRARAATRILLHAPHQRNHRRHSPAGQSDASYYSYSNQLLAVDHGFSAEVGQGWHDPSPVTGEHAVWCGAWQYCAANRALDRVQPETNPRAKTRRTATRIICQLQKHPCIRRRRSGRIYSAMAPIEPVCKTGLWS